MPRTICDISLSGLIEKPHRVASSSFLMTVNPPGLEMAAQQCYAVTDRLRARLSECSFILRAYSREDRRMGA